MLPKNLISKTALTFAFFVPFKWEKKIFAKTRLHLPFSWLISRGVLTWKLFSKYLRKNFCKKPWTFAILVANKWGPFLQSGHYRFSALSFKVKAKEILWETEISRLYASASPNWKKQAELSRMLSSQPFSPVSLPFLNRMRLFAFRSHNPT